MSMLAWNSITNIDSMSSRRILVLFEEARAGETSCPLASTDLDILSERGSW